MAYNTRHERIRTDLLTQHDAGKPSPALKSSIQIHGMLTPIVVADYGDDDYEILDGRRRVAVAKALKLEHVPAVIVSFEETAGERTRPLRPSAPLIYLNLHGTRSDNPIAETEAIREYSLTLEDQTPAIVQNTITGQTGYNAATLKKRLRVLNLNMHLYTLFYEGKISPTVAEALANTSPEVQAEALDQYKALGKITADMVAEIKRAKTVTPAPAVTDERRNTVGFLLMAAQEAIKAGITEEKFIAAARSAYQQEAQKQDQP